MKFFQGFFKGLGHCFKSFQLIFSKELWPFMILPLLSWGLLFIIGLYSFSGLSNIIAENINTYFDIENIPETGVWYSFLKPFLTGYFSFIISIILKIVFFFIAGTLTKYVLLIFLSPVFSLLSEAVEKKLTHKTYSFSMVQLLKDIFRGIILSLRNMILEYLFMFLCFILTLLFPPLAIVTTPILFLVSWYFFGFTLFDYNFERHRLSIRDSIRIARKNMGLLCGIGMFYAFFISLPFFPGTFIGLALGPAVATTAATIAFLEIRNHLTYLSATHAK